MLVKDHTKLMGFGTTRVVGKGLNKSGLSATQMKGMSTLQNICGVKKEKKPEEEMINKLSTLKGADGGPKKSRLFTNMEENSNTSTSGNSEDKDPNTKKKENPSQPKEKKVGFSLKNLMI